MKTAKEIGNTTTGAGIFVWALYVDDTRDVFEDVCYANLHEVVSQFVGDIPYPSTLSLHDWGESI